MSYEWDEAKRATNLEKHGLDFRDCRLMFDDRPALHVPARHHEEERFLTIAAIGAKFYTVVWCWRGHTRRIISFRRARHEEERAYRNLHGQ